jgi:hypothetical protein
LRGCGGAGNDYFGYGKADYTQALEDGHCDYPGKRKGGGKKRACFFG